jgi:hypothetical protein
MPEPCHPATLDPRYGRVRSWPAGPICVPTMPTSVLPMPFRKGNEVHPGNSQGGRNDARRRARGGASSASANPGGHLIASHRGGAEGREEKKKKGIQFLKSSRLQNATRHPALLWPV